VRDWLTKVMRIEGKSLLAGEKRGKESLFFPTGNSPGVIHFGAAMSEFQISRMILHWPLKLLRISKYLPSLNKLRAAGVMSRSPSMHDAIDQRSFVPRVGSAKNP
jgi:hypothetical protein